MDKAYSFQNKYLFHITIVILLIGLAYFPLFLNLGATQIKLWDEATYANNSLDMLYEDADLFVIKTEGKIDLYNTKPPLVIWLQAISMKIFGMNEFAIRFPSALFGLFTVLIVFLFCLRNFDSAFIGFLASMILVTSQGFVANHVTRTGDLDSVLVFFLTLGILTFIDLIVSKPENPKSHFIILAVSLILGFLSKGIAGFLLILPMILIVIFNKDHSLLKDKRLYLSATIVLLVCSGYYFAREVIAPGYVKVVLETEIFRINQEVMSWHVQPFDFYLRNLINTEFNFFIYIIPFSIINLLILKSKKYYLYIYVLVSALSYFLIISFPAVKLEWYSAPLIPLLSIIAGLTIVVVIRFLFEKINKLKGRYTISILLSIITIAILYNPYNNILKTIAFPPSYIYPMEYEGLYLKQLSSIHPEIKKITVFKIEKNKELYDQVLFYKRILEQENIYQIKITKEPFFENNEIVMVSKPYELELLTKNYLTEKINTQQSGSLHKIIHKIH